MIMLPQAAVRGNALTLPVAGLCRLDPASAGRFRRIGRAVPFWLVIAPRIGENRHG